jgi:hypothetical protein
MPHGPTPTSHLLVELSALIQQLPWFRSVNRRQQSQPWHPIKCGPSLEPVSVHVRRFRDEWTAALRSIAQQCPSAAAPCRILLRLDPLPPDSDAGITDAIAAIRHLSDPRTVRSMAREKERSSFGGTLRRLRMERGLSLRGLAGACKQPALRLSFRSHSPEHYQTVAYEGGRLGTHRRTRMVMAAALGVPLSDLTA